MSTPYYSDEHAVGRKRSGTETRKRQCQVGVRLLPGELADLQEHAEREHVSPGEILRRAFFEAHAGIVWPNIRQPKGPKQMPRIPVSHIRETDVAINREALARALYVEDQSMQKLPDPAETPMPPYWLEFAGRLISSMDWQDASDLPGVFASALADSKFAVEVVADVFAGLDPVDDLDRASAREALRLLCDFLQTAPGGVDTAVSELALLRERVTEVSDAYLKSWQLTAGASTLDTDVAQMLRNLLVRGDGGGLSDLLGEGKSVSRNGNGDPENASDGA